MPARSSSRSEFTSSVMVERDGVTLPTRPENWIKVPADVSPQVAMKARSRTMRASSSAPAAAAAGHGTPASVCRSGSGCSTIVMLSISRPTTSFVRSRVNGGPLALKTWLTPSTRLTAVTSTSAEVRRVTTPFACVIVSRSATQN